MERAGREAKTATSWLRPDPEYEADARAFFNQALDNGEFVAAMSEFVALIADAGYVNSLAQCLIKLTAPGVPDIYQGNELWAFSLTDPDNRRPVDFARRRRLLAEAKKLPASEVWRRRAEGLPKIWLIHKVLDLRRRNRGLLDGASSYEPIEVGGAKAAHVVAYLRSGRVATVAPRLVIGLGGDWADTTIILPPGCWTSPLTGESVEGGPVLLRRLLGQFPVALVARRGEP